MIARLRSAISDLREAFWLVPALLVLVGGVAGLALVAVDRSGIVTTSVIASPWIYDGGPTGARTLLGTVASSSIGVAGTAFSITIAALSLAAGQMGPRLLRNFVRDRGNQVTLGAFLGTFVYALMVLRSVRTQEEGAFIPHVALSVGILLAVVCVGMLVYFIGHMAGRINVETVIDLVSDEVGSTMRRFVDRNPGPPAPGAQVWAGALMVRDRRRGYLQHLDADRLADWLDQRGIRLRLLVRAGDYVFPGAPFAEVIGWREGVEAAIVASTALSQQRVSSEDLEFALRQLVEVGVRALSAGINDPYTAISVLDRLGAAFCDLASLHLPTGVTLRRGAAVLVVPAVDYDGLADTAFHMMREDAAGSVAVLMRLLEVLTVIAQCESDPRRRATLARHADLAMVDAERTIANRGDLDDLRRRHRRFRDVADCDLTTIPAAS